MYLLSRIFGVIGLILLGACTTPQQLQDSNEKLVIDTQNWTLQNKAHAHGGIETVVYVHKTEKQLLVVETYGKGKFDDIKNAIIELPASCINGNNDLISQSFVNNYLQATWHTQCQQMEGRQRPYYAINRAISGDENQYIISLVMRSKVSQAELDSHIRFISGISACNLKSDVHSCPINFQ